MTYDLTRVPPPLFVELSVSEKMVRPKVYNEGFEYTWITFHELHKVTARFSYAQAGFKGGYRRKKNVQRLGNVWIYDIDHGYRIEDVLPMLQGLRCMIVTTVSHTEQHHRFRLIIPTDKIITEPISSELHKELMTVVLELAGLDIQMIDRACFDIARQFAPNPDQRHFHVKGDIVPLAPVWNYAVERLAERKRGPSLASFPPVPEYRGESVIEAFNRDHTVEEMLGRYGFKKKGDKWLSPNSSSGLPGVAIIEGNDGKRRAWSHHASDGWERAMDPFDLFVHYEHNGNLQSAVQSLKGAA